MKLRGESCARAVGKLEETCWGNKYDQAKMHKILKELTIILLSYQVWRQFEGLSAFVSFLGHTMNWYSGKEGSLQT